MKFEKYDEWNIRKKVLAVKDNNLYAHEREIFWCSLGCNIGVETNGSGDYFERPVIIMKVYNNQSALILPITSKNKADRFHFKISVKNKDAWVKVTQARTVSTLRLRKKIEYLHKETFSKLYCVWKQHVK
jgi:mRNA-degrading endonuclease toxin of MazEF toxin-antitoxin module